MTQNKTKENKKIVLPDLMIKLDRKLAEKKITKLISNNPRLK